MFITSVTSNLVAILTRKGRQLLSDNSSNFQIVGFSFSDDEVDYSLFDGSSIDAPNTDILNLPILEPSSNSNGNSAQRYQLLSLPSGILNISKIIVDGINDNQTFILNRTQRNSSIHLSIKTLYGRDSRYYLTSSDPNVLSVESDYIDSNDDPDMSQVLQKQTFAASSFQINNSGNATLTIIGSDTKSVYKNNITITNVNINGGGTTTQPVSPPIVAVQPSLRSDTTSILLSKSGKDIAVPKEKTINIFTIDGKDGSYIVSSRNTFIANPLGQTQGNNVAQNISAKIDANGNTSCAIKIQSSRDLGSTFLDITGNDSKATLSIQIQVIN